MRMLETFSKPTTNVCRFAIFISSYLVMYFLLAIQDELMKYTYLSYIAYYVLNSICMHIVHIHAYCAYSCIYHISYIMMDINLFRKIFALMSWKTAPYLLCRGMCSLCCVQCCLMSKCMRYLCTKATNVPVTRTLFARS